LTRYILPLRRNPPLGVNEIPALSSDGHVNVFVEIPKDSQNKYEYDEELGMIVLDRTLHSSVHYPTDYSFVPGTRGADGESLDAMVIVDKSTFSGCLVETRLVGVLTIRSTNGRPEQKLLGVPVREPSFAEYEDVSDVPGHLLREIEHFFEVFKDLEGSDIGVLGWAGAQEAEGLLEQAIRTEEDEVESAKASS
jgi:inorganic pyrophosphatase